MIRADIATAALSEESEQRVRIAALLLAAYRIRAQVRPWDGTRCALLVADISDGYGRQAYELAKKRGSPILILNATAGDVGPGIASFADGSPAPAMAHAMRELLSTNSIGLSTNSIGLSTNSIGSSERGGDSGDGSSPALCRLAGTDFCGKPIDATSNGRIVRIRPEAGRVYASSMSDLLSARDSFLGGDWTFSIANEDDVERRNDDANSSLDAFLLQAAFRHRERLPAFPAGRYRLKNWPDIGSAPELIGALKVAGALMRRPMSADELGSACGVTAHDVNACLWAYQAANLLEATDVPVQASPPPRTGAFSGVLARIASRFGLGAG